MHFDLVNLSSVLLNELLSATLKQSTPKNLERLFLSGVKIIKLGEIYLFGLFPLELVSLAVIPPELPTLGRYWPSSIFFY